MTARAVIAETSVPRLPRGTRLKHDETRGQWVILAPERLFVLDETAHAIMSAVDGTASVGAIVDELAARFEAPREVILSDVIALLQDFADKGVIAA
jgi:pyrroloquinoline quinone biosynthesis protein D